MREREQLFSEHIAELKRASKLKQEHQKQQASKSRTDKVRTYRLLLDLELQRTVV